MLFNFHSNGIKAHNNNSHNIMNLKHSFFSLCVEMNKIFAAGNTFFFYLIFYLFLKSSFCVFPNLALDFKRFFLLWRVFHFFFLETEIVFLVFIFLHLSFLFFCIKQAVMKKEGLLFAYSIFYFTSRFIIYNIYLFLFLFF